MPYFPDELQMKRFLTSSLGSLVVVHAPNMSPSMSNGILVHPNAEVNVAVTRSVIKRLPYPYSSNCIDDYPSHLKRFTQTGLSYNIDKCLNICYRQLIRRHCNCSMKETYNDGEIVFDLNRTKFCSSNILSNDMTCMVNKLQDTSGICQECKPECYHERFQVRQL